jgi:hypothetical protein
MEDAIYLCIGFITLYWFVALQIENRKQTHYWRGRKDGWDMHRRFIQNKQLSGEILMTTKKHEVFDYDKD